MTASDGNARPRFGEVDRERARRGRVCPIHRPIGMATAIAITSEAPDRARCSSSRVGMPAGPAQLPASASQAMVASIGFMRRSPPRARLDPGGRVAVSGVSGGRPAPRA